MGGRETECVCTFVQHNSVYVCVKIMMYLCLCAITQHVCVCLWGNFTVWLLVSMHSCKKSVTLCACVCVCMYCISRFCLSALYSCVFGVFTKTSGYGGPHTSDTLSTLVYCAPQSVKVGVYSTYLHLHQHMCPLHLVLTFDEYLHLHLAKKNADKWKM